MRALGLLWRHRALVAVLVRRELTARYRASVLGFFWSLLNPLLLLAVYAVVFTSIFQPRFPGGDPYPLFLFAGCCPGCSCPGPPSTPAVTMVDNGPLLAKVMCPPEIFPAVTVVSHLFHLLLALPVLLLALCGARSPAGTLSVDGGADARGAGAVAAGDGGHRVGGGGPVGALPRPARPARPPPQPPVLRVADHLLARRPRGAGDAARVLVLNRWRRWSRCSRRRLRGPDRLARQLGARARGRPGGVGPGTLGLLALPRHLVEAV